MMSEMMDDDVRDRAMLSEMMGDDVRDDGR
jgi:hypothetical protein